MKIRTPKIPLLILFLNYFVYLFVAINWWWFVQVEVALFGSSLINAHISFVLIGAVIYGLCGSPFMFWSYRYSNQMPPNLRRNATFLSVWVSFLAHDFPLWLMEFWIAWEYGMKSVIQGVSLATLSLTTFIGFFGVWIGYAWKVSGLLQKSSSEAPAVVLTHRGIRGALGPSQEHQI